MSRQIVTSAEETQEDLIAVRKTESPENRVLCKMRVPERRQRGRNTGEEHQRNIEVLGKAVDVFDNVITVKAADRNMRSRIKQR